LLKTVRGILVLPLTLVLKLQFVLGRDPGEETGHPAIEREQTVVHFGDQGVEALRDLLIYENNFWLI
jgi:hypothetical protein